MSPWGIASILIITVVGTAVATIRSRTLANIHDPPTDVLACRILLFDVMSLPSHDTATTGDFWMCNPVRDGAIASQLYPLDLPPHVAAAHRTFVATQSTSSSSARSLEDFYIGIPYGYIDELETNIGIPDPLNIYVMNVTHHHHRRRRRHLERQTVTSIGTYTALVVRITDNKGRNPFHSAQELTRTAFDPVGISAHSQYRNCSWGQFTIVPAGGDDPDILAQPGVLEVIVDLDISTKDYRQVTQEAEKEALTLLGVENLFDYTDFILYVTPPMGSWVAYASVGGGYSVYNSMWGGFLSSLVHEIGHNLGLLHANEGVLGAEESRYQDFSGYMSGSQSTYMSEKYPIQCFNGANHWELLWYKTSGHAHEVFPQDAPEIVYIGAFADRNKFLNGSGSPEYAVVKVGDFYLQYNGAWGINVHTNEAANRLTITQQWDDGTYLVGDINNIRGRSWTLDRIDWSIEICDVAQGSSSKPEVLKVWIGTGTPDCTLTNPPTTNDGDCKGHQQTCTTDDDCCSQSCRPTGNGPVCLPNPNAHQLKNELRISRHHQLAHRTTSAVRGSRSDYRR